MGETVGVAPPSGAPLPVIKLIILSVLHRFAQKEEVPPMVGYSLLLPKNENPEVRTIPGSVKLENVTECDGKSRNPGKTGKEEGG